MIRTYNQQTFAHKAFKTRVCRASARRFIVSVPDTPRGRRPFKRYPTDFAALNTSNMGALHNDIEKVLYTEEAIAQAVNKLGKQLSADYAGKRPLILGTLCGAFIFMADLVRSIEPVPADLDMDFLRISSYVGTQSSGDSTMAMQSRLPVKGRHVLVVEDIVDTGRTLKSLISSLQQQGVASVKIVTLLNKQARRTVDIQADYVGIQCPDEFVVGYGLDFEHKYRSLPYIGVLHPKCYELS